MNLTQQLFNAVLSQAREKPRLRMGCDFRTSADDGSKRMLNALEPGTIMFIHCHQNTSEAMIMARGSLKEYLYDAQGNLSDTILCAAGSDCVGINIPPSQWHSLECLESGTVIFEAKDRPYQPLSNNDILQK